MAVKFLDFTGLQKFWAKCKNAFVAKDDTGCVSVDGDLNVDGDIDIGNNLNVSGDIESDGAVEVKKGNNLTLYNDDNSQQVSMHCDENGSAIIDGHVEIKQTLLVESGLTVEDSVEVQYGNSINFWNDNNTKVTRVYGSADGSTISVGDNLLATQAYVTSAVANAPHVTREKVSALPNVSLAKENVIYMLTISGASGDDTFDEYMLFDGKLEKIGSSRIDLSGYANTAITGAEIDALA